MISHFCEEMMRWTSSPVGFSALALLLFGADNPFLWVVLCLVECSAAPWPPLTRCRAPVALGREHWTRSRVPRLGVPMMSFEKSVNLLKFVCELVCVCVCDGHE